MKNRTLFLGGVAAMLVLTAGLSFTSFNSEETRESPEFSEFNVNTTEDGTRYTVHPEELVQGCPGKDCIPSIDDPNYVEDPDWLRPDDRVIGVEINGDARAYPLKILRLHEIVNTEVGGEPVAITYCPLCRSGLVYSREVGHETLEFGVSGKLHNANLVMYDRSTESYWNQIQGEAIIGPRTPQQLDLKFSNIANWCSWKAEHPEARVLSRNTGVYPASSYEGNSYAGYRQRERVGFGVENVDQRLGSKTIVYGIVAGNESKAYTEKVLREEKLIRDTPGGEEATIFWNSGSVKAFSGSFEEVPEDQASRINVQEFFWFAWSKFRPDTKVYNVSGEIS